MMRYLKALGVFRVVAQQADRDARMSWSGGIFRLHSQLGLENLMTFLLERYCPTPLVAPWNALGGFYGKTTEAVDRIADSTTDRLQGYRAAIATCRALLPKHKPKDDQKHIFLGRCRAELPDDSVPWLDVCFALREEGPTYFPLLGTGGNDGRLDFAKNFMVRLADVMPFDADTAPSSLAKRWLAASLGADTLVEVGKSAIGQFDPGGIGGINGGPGFEAPARVNPWDFVLMMEGTLLFAGSAARRWATRAFGRSMFPFCVDSVAVGYGSAIALEESSHGSRGELWLPLWSKPITWGEAQQLFGEGRARLGRRRVQNAMEIALAASLQGIHGVVESFARYGFLKRNGQAFLALPLGRVPVIFRPHAELLDDPPLRVWISRLRELCQEQNVPGRFLIVLREIDEAMFALATGTEPGDPVPALVRVLVSLGRAERTLATTGAAYCKERYFRPLQGLSPRWLDWANDHSPEFRLAASLAGIRARGAVGPLRLFLEEVAETDNAVVWSPGSPLAMWSQRGLAANLAAVFRRRHYEASSNRLAGVPLSSPVAAGLDDVIAFLRGEVDEDKLSDLLWGLLSVDYGNPVRTRTGERDIPLEFAVPRLLVQARRLQASPGQWKLTNQVNANAQPDPQVFHLLASGLEDAAMRAFDWGTRRLQAGGLPVRCFPHRRHAGRRLDSTVPAQRLLAALLFPLADADLDRFAHAVLCPPEGEQ